MFCVDYQKKLGDNCMAVIVRFVVLLYDRTSSTVEVNKSRKDIFSKKARSLLRENTPPTRAAQEQHTMRAVFQEGYIWVQVLLKNPLFHHPLHGDGKKMGLPGDPSGQLFLEQRRV